jgi:hypothetical protein
MVVGFTTTCAISVYCHLSCEFKPHSWWGVLDTTLCDKVCQWQVGGFVNPTTIRSRPQGSQVFIWDSTKYMYFYEIMYFRI